MYLAGVIISIPVFFTMEKKEAIVCPKSKQINTTRCAELMENILGSQQAAGRRLQAAWPSLGNFHSKDNKIDAGSSFLPICDTINTPQGLATKGHSSTRFTKVKPAVTHTWETEVVHVSVGGEGADGSAFGSAGILIFISSISQLKKQIGNYLAVHIAGLW